jgi:hypothetical protein
VFGFNVGVVTGCFEKGVGFSVGVFDIMLPKLKKTFSIEVKFTEPKPVTGSQPVVA